MSRYSVDDHDQFSIDYSYQNTSQSGNTTGTRGRGICPTNPSGTDAPSPCPKPVESQALSVTAALAVTKKQLETIRLTIIGEISEISDKPGYKAIYFTISDESSALPCLIWRNVFERQGVGQLQRGMLVEITGRFSLYAAKGRMSFDVHGITLAGEGRLRLRVAELAKKLQAQGLMDAAHKLPIPAIPEQIALVTSPRGKAVHDVIRTLRRRFPLAEVLLFGVAVEGQQAAQEIIHGLQAAQQSQASVILLVRGGGSYEDLMPFNDEDLAIQIANSRIPVITGIGHEPDNSIADMVAAFRASTPTAAAERAVPDINELAVQLSASQTAINRNLGNQLATRQLWLNGIIRMPLFNSSQALTQMHTQSLEQTWIRLQNAIPNALAQTRAIVDNAGKRLPVIGNLIL